MSIRYTAKGLISCKDQKIVVVAGKRGMWNLPGGGIDYGETPGQAFLREADEEVDRLSAHLADPLEAFVVQGPTTPAGGATRLARWTVFTAGLLVPSTELTIAMGSEITAITALTPEQCLAHPNMSDLAKMAVELAVNSELKLAEYAH